MSSPSVNVDVDVLLANTALTNCVAPLLITTVPSFPVPDFAPAPRIKLPPSRLLPPAACPVIVVCEPAALPCAGRTIETALSSPSVNVDVPLSSVTKFLAESLITRLADSLALITNSLI